jgi:uncharacterized protein (DUF1810 family)
LLHEDPHNLGRFPPAQDAVYQRVRAELAAGAKRSHWMWFIFPQLQGLGSSATARNFALAGLDEARAYLAHPLLGVRLRECTALVIALEGRTAEEIFGYPDHMKFHSSMTLFARAAASEPDRQLFRQALACYFGGEEDPLTVRGVTSGAGTSG